MKKLLLIFATLLTLNASDIVIKELPCGVHEAAKELQSVLKEKNFTIFAKINHAANAKAVGMELPQSMMFVFGKAKMGTKLMQQDPTVALDLPLRIIIFEDKEGKTKIAYRDGSWLARAHVINAPGIIEKINKGLDAITQRVITECKR